MTKTLSAVSTGWSLGPIIGPAIGGYLQHYFNWQADFYFFSVYGLLVSLHAYLFLSETHFNRICMDPKTICLNIKKILFHPVFLFGVMLASLYYSALVIFNAVGPFLIQVKLKYSAIDYGHIALFLGFAYFIGNFSNRISVNYFDPMNIVLSAILLLLIASSAMVGIAIFTAMNLYTILIPVFIIFTLCGFIIPNIVAKCLDLFPNIAGTANALYGSLFAAGAFVMTVIITLLKTNTQLPLSLTYVTICFVCLGLFGLMKFFNNRLSINNAT